MSNLKKTQSIESKYCSQKTRLFGTTENNHIRNIVAYLERGECDLNPDYQRDYVWNNTQAARLIESLLDGIPTGIITLMRYPPKMSRACECRVIDGKQRLTSIKRFFDNKFALENLQRWPELNGLKFNDLPDIITQGLYRARMTIMIVDPPYNWPADHIDEFEQHIFKVINTYGEPMTVCK